MKKLHVVALLFSIFLFISSCNNEEKITIGQGYYYFPFQESVFDQTTFGGNGIYTYRKYLVVPIIYPNIINYKYDSLFIIVKQNFDLMETHRLLEAMIFNPNHFSYDKDIVPLEERFVINAPKFNSSVLEDKYVDSIMHIDFNIKKMMKNKENYYIIDKIKHVVHGPLTKNEFIKKSEALHISDKLNLE